jgi:hypothetical protein
MLTVALVMVASGCGGSSESGTNSVESVPTVTEVAADDPDFVRTSDSSNGDAVTATTTVVADSQVGESTTSTVPDSGATPGTIAIVSDTGVPGIDSDDVFCRSWSEFAGSFQALALASAVGDPANAFRLEVFASTAVIQAVERLGANLPVALESERSALLEGYAGPLARRAANARQALQNAGVANPDDLGDAWLVQLADSGVDEPELSVQLPATIDADAFAAAVAIFAKAVPPIAEDPSLITDAIISRTESYLVANCPDGGVLSGNDVVS